MSKTQTRTLLLKRGSLNLVMSSSVFAQRVAVSPHFPSFHGRQYDSAEFANLPKTGNLSTLLAAPSMLKPMEKLSELSKQQRTCFKRKMTLQKLSWHTNPYPCGVERAHLSYFLAARSDAPSFALQRPSNRAGQE